MENIKTEDELQEFISTYVKQDKKPYYFWLSFIKALAPVFYRPKFIGLENIPKEGAVVLASNHSHLPDPAFMMMSTDRVIRFLAKKELLDSPLGPIFKSACTIPVDRKHNAHNSLAAGEAALNMGEMIGIFPEGTRNKNGFGTLLPFKMGAVKMAADTGAMIVPVALISKGRPFIHPYTIRIGEGYTIDKDCDLKKENDILRDKIQALLDE